MRKLLLAALLAAVPTVASAQVGYVEGAIGQTLIPDVETKNYTLYDPSLGTFIGHGELDFGSEFSGGAEIGFARERFRFGLSWDYATAEIDTVRLVGTLDGSPYSEEMSGAELEDVTGISFDENVHILGANAYYNFGAPEAMWRPYIGAGAGLAMFQNADSEFALQLTAGVRFALGTNAYLGGRYRFAWIKGPEDDIGIAYEDINLHTFSVVLGFYFGGP